MNREKIDKKIKELADNILKYDYSNLDYLKKAMYCKKIECLDKGKNNKTYANDSFATFGDTILKFIVAEVLFLHGFDKGEITDIKKYYEANATLYSYCDKLNIYLYAYNDDYFYSEAPNDQSLPHSSHDQYLEAIIAAIYLDRGMDYVKTWVKKLLDLEKKEISSC